MDEGAPFLPADPLRGGEGFGDVGHHDQLGAVAQRLGHASGIGAGQHDDLRVGLQLARRPGCGDRMIAGAYRGHPARQRIGGQAQHHGEGAPRLEGAGMLEQLELEVDPGAGRQPGRDLGAIPVEDRRVRDPAGQLGGRGPDFGQGWWWQLGHGLLSLGPVDGIPVSPQAAAPRSGRADANLSRRHGAAAAGLGGQCPDRGRAFGQHRLGRRPARRQPTPSGSTASSSPA